MVNFTQCAANYLALAPDDPLRLLYGWSGSVEGIERNSITQISEHGCVEFCGDGNDLYPWSQSSNTITTWVLPVVGMLLQAPFVSNAFWQTILSLARWVGSPMASLSYILWNIKVSGKCVMMGKCFDRSWNCQACSLVAVDMAIPYGDYPSEKSDFGSIRDSFYILSTMNQYTMKRRAMRKKESEGLLRIVLFSKDLKLLDPSRTLDERRRAMAQEMREGRRRGVVPVFISTMWFLFSLAISIQSAFGYLGSNATAHDLALGCLLSWMPVLILCSIVDRNPVASEDIRNKLNDLVDIVRQSLIDDTIRDKFIESCPRETVEDMRLWIETIAAHCPKMDHFFQDFAGQGRVRWHYGAAHPILSDIEMTYVALQGRDWLRNESEARTRLVLGSVTEGLDWFDYRELWQISSAIIIVGATCGGAFILSFFTPTVGLGCRSGGYTIFFCISFILLFVEMLIWWCVDANKPLVYQFGDQLNRTFTRRLTMVGWHAEVPARYARIQDRARRAAAAAASAIFDGLLTLIPSYEQRDKINNAKQQMIKAWEESTLQGRFEYLFFRPVEVFNASWLIYITLAQTFGSYVNCHCMSSTWAGGGGYIDFTQYSTTSSPWVKLYWTSGAVISAGVMGIAMTYVVVEVGLKDTTLRLDVTDTHRSSGVSNPTSAPLPGLAQCVASAEADNSGSTPILSGSPQTWQSKQAT
ncbi:hypothetical protein M8818_004063 [Zalaria obscura]|uniref:Uncharacterized protein n=1 Tax=Zalaria obscura TaxID=2024903 RepID=A0ACC3SDG4_9PEZI